MKKLLLISFAVSCSFLLSAQQPDSTWQIKNLSINSVADDYGPFLIDSILFFTSTRRNNREDKILENTEKVYYSPLIDTSFGKTKKFSYKANSDANTALVGCSDSNFFFYQSYFPDNGEIFIAKRKQETRRIKRLKKVPYILSDFDENSIAVKGDSIYFTSNRNGNYDIYFQTGNKKPVHVEMLNSDFDEVSVWLSPSGKELYFSSNRDGKFDIYRSDLVDGKWQSPKKLPYPINSKFDEQDYRQYNDSKIYFASNRTNGSGAYDIYQLIKPEPIEIKDTSHIDSIVVKPIATHQKDSLPTIAAREKTIPEKEKTPRIELFTQLEYLGIDSIKAEIQLGAYRSITSIKQFKSRFNCVENENIRMDVFASKKGAPLRKYILDTIFSDLDKALNKQKEIIQKNCFPKEKRSIPFIALLRADNKRYAIFLQKGEQNDEEMLSIMLDGKTVWQNK